VEGESQPPLWPPGDPLHERINNDQNQRQRAGRDGVPVQTKQNDATDGALEAGEHPGLFDRNGARRDWPSARARHARVDVAIHDVIVGAAGAAHHNRADAEQNQQPPIPAGAEKGVVLFRSAQRESKYAGPKKQPCPDGAVQSCEPKVRLPRRRCAGDPGARDRVGGNGLRFVGHASLSHRQTLRPNVVDDHVAAAVGKVRLHVEAPLEKGAQVEASEGQVHYLLHVMRAKAGDRVSLFNGRDGEWLAAITDAGKRRCTFICEYQTRPQRRGPDLWLCFAPIKKTPADYLAQKATELGVSVLQPVTTQRTIVTRVNTGR